jgi:ABC-type phosphate/phosphonate transport system substrate-binding protein
MTIASLAMYPYPHLRSAYDQLWDGVRSKLSFAAPELDWVFDALPACRRDDLLLGQTCGWPLITELAATVRVVGTFDYDVEGASDGTYCSVLISAEQRESLAHILGRPDLVVAANSVDSLSGWISLRSVAATHGVLDGPPEKVDQKVDQKVEWTGSHAASVDAVRWRRAHLASIDAVSWAHLDVSGLSIVGHGPRVPCLPLVSSGSTSDGVVGELRAALAATVRDSAMADACATLKIRDFLVRDLADYEGLHALAALG